MRARAAMPAARPPFATLALALAAALASAQPPQTAYTITGSPSLGGATFDGVGAAFTGAAARLLFEYDAATQSAILDYLFAPVSAPASAYKGAALSILKLEVGGGANTGFGAEPSYMPSQTDAQDATRGWSGRLAQAAVARNPDIKIMLVPQSWPAFLVAPGAKDPFDDVAAASGYVADYVQLFAKTWGVVVSHVGIFGYVDGASASPTMSDRQVNYIVALRAALSARALGDVQIVCADQENWACAQAVDKDSPSYKGDDLLAAVGVLGNRGAPSGAERGSAIKGIRPLWSTDFARINARNDGAMALASSIFDSFLGSNSTIGGWIVSCGLSTTPYGFPGYHLGLIDASQPWSGHYSTTPALWAAAHFGQFVPAGYKIAPASPSSTASGSLSKGGSYMTFYDQGSFDFVICIYKPTSGDDEIATFTLADSFAERNVLQVDVWVTYFQYYIWGTAVNQTHLSHHIGLVGVSNNQFTLEINKTALVTVYVPQLRALAPHNGCDTRDCKRRLPPPAAFGSRTLAFDAASCAPRAPGTLMVDVSGQFECLTDADPAVGAALALASTGAPLGPFEETLPHSLTGDESMADMDVSVDVFLRQDATALLGLRVTPLNTSVTPAPLAMNYARGLWLAATPRAGGALEWRLVLGLDVASQNAPLFAGTLQNFAATGAWATLRVVARGKRVVGSIGPAAKRAPPPQQEGAAPPGGLRGAAGGANGGAKGVNDKGPSAVGLVLPGGSLLFNSDVSIAPSAGFVGLATGEWAPRLAYFRNLDIRASTTTCSAVPVREQQLFMEMCELNAGTGFEFVPVDTDPTHDTYALLWGFDAEDEDSGPNMAYEGQPCYGNFSVACFMAACSANSTQNASATPCVGFNANGYPKGAFDIVGPTELTNLYVKNVPAGLIQLSVDPTLCVEAVDMSPAVPNLLLRPCDAAVAAQLWTVEKSVGDSGWLTGPVRNAGNGGVMDVNFLQEGLTAGSVDAPVNTYGFHASSNQLFHFEAGMLRATQLGSLCLGACAYL